MTIHQLAGEFRRLNSAGLCEEARLSFAVTGIVSRTELDEAVTAVRGMAPASVDGAAASDLELSFREDYFEITVIYSRDTGSVGRSDSENRQQAAAGDRHWSFGSLCRSRRVQYGLELVRTIDGGGTAPDPGLSIGWNGRNGLSSHCTGAMKYLPEFCEKCRAVFASSRIDNSFRRRLAETVGAVNSAVFRGWSAGEALLLQADIGEAFRNAGGSELREVEYSFGIRTGGNRSVDGLSVTGVGGWNEVWSITRRHPLTGVLSREGVYETRLYPAADFSQLGL